MLLNLIYCFFTRLELDEEDTLKEDRIRGVWRFFFKYLSCIELQTQNLVAFLSGTECASVLFFSLENQFRRTPDERNMFVLPKESIRKIFYNCFLG